MFKTDKIGQRLFFRKLSKGNFKRFFSHFFNFFQLSYHKLHWSLKTKQRTHANSLFISFFLFSLSLSPFSMKKVAKHKIFQIKFRCRFLVVCLIRRRHQQTNKWTIVQCCIKLLHHVLTLLSISMEKSILVGWSFKCFNFEGWLMTELMRERE